MSILSDLQEIKKLNSSSLSTIINISNENFEKISQALYAYLSNIVYDEELNKMSPDEIQTKVATINERIQLIVNSDTMFSVNANGEVRSKTFVADDIAEAKRFRLFRYDGYPLHGIPGEIVYGQRTLTENLDFWGYIQGIGWLSLTDRNGGSVTGGSWVGAVLGIYSSEPPLTGYMRYLVDWRTTATGAFANHEGQIAQWNTNSNAWEFRNVPPGSVTAVENEFNMIYVAQNTDPRSWMHYFAGSVLSTADQERYPDHHITLDHSPTGITLSLQPIPDSQIMVTVNGLKVLLGNNDKTKDAYFSRDGGVTALPLSQIQIGDELIWNGVLSEYDLETDDLVSMDYLVIGDIGVSGGTTRNSVDVTIGDTVEAGDFVNIYEEAGVTKIRPANAYMGWMAHGYVLLDGAIGTIATVYLDGINNMVNYLSPSPDISGPNGGAQEIYLSTYGKATATIVNYGSPNILFLQTLGNYIGQGRAIVNIDVNPVEV